MSDTQELAIIPRENALTVFTTVGGMEPILAKVRAEIDANKADITTAKGRTALASFARKVASFKVQIDEIGKDLADEQKEIPKKIDAERKRVRDLLDQWKDEVRKPLTEWEEKEKARLERHNAGIAHLTELAANLDGLDSATLRAAVTSVEAVGMGDHWHEFKDKAQQTRDVSLKTIRAQLAVVEKREADEAELLRLRNEAAARMRRENEERIAREAADKARQEAETIAAAKAAEAQAEREQAEREAAERLAAAEKAAKDQQEAAERKRKAEADAAAKREADLKQQREQAEKQKQEAEERAALAEQQGRLKAIREQEQKLATDKAEAEKREANKAHQAKINRAALAALVAGGVPEEAAKQAITLIAGRKIPAVSIAY